MKKGLSLDPNKMLECCFNILIIYCLLSIIRSSGLLYIAYTDDYFYNFDFNIKFYQQKSCVFNYAYYYCPYIIGFFISFFFKQILKLNWKTSIMSLIFGFVLFRLIDSKLIRPIFDFFENPRMNIIFHLLTFLFLELLLVIIYIKHFNRFRWVSNKKNDSQE